MYAIVHGALIFIRIQEGASVVNTRRLKLVWLNLALAVSMGAHAQSPLQKDEPPPISPPPVASPAPPAGQVSSANATSIAAPTLAQRIADDREAITQLKTEIRTAEERAILTSQRAVEFMKYVVGALATVVVAIGALVGWFGLKSFSDAKKNLNRQLEKAREQSAEFERVTERARATAGQLDRTASLAHLFTVHFGDGESRMVRAIEYRDQYLKAEASADQDELSAKFNEYAQASEDSYLEAREAIGMGVEFPAIRSALDGIADRPHQANLKRVVCYIESRLALLRHYRGHHTIALDHAENCVSVNVRQIPDHYYNHACMFAASREYPGGTMTAEKAGQLQQHLDRTFECAAAWDASGKGGGKLLELIVLAKSDDDLKKWRSRPESAAFLESWRAQCFSAAPSPKRKGPRRALIRRRIKRR